MLAVWNSETQEKFLIDWSAFFFFFFFFLFSVLSTLTTAWCTQQELQIARKLAPPLKGSWVLEMLHFTSKIHQFRDKVDSGWVQLLTTCKRSQTSWAFSSSEIMYVSSNNASEGGQANMALVFPSTPFNLPPSLFDFGLEQPNHAASLSVKNLRSVEFFMARQSVVSACQHTPTCSISKAFFRAAAEPGKAAQLCVFILGTQHLYLRVLMCVFGYGCAVYVLVKSLSALDIKRNFRRHKSLPHWNATLVQE